MFVVVTSRLGCCLICDASAFDVVAAIFAAVACETSGAFEEDSNCVGRLQEVRQWTDVDLDLLTH